MSVSARRSAASPIGSTAQIDEVRTSTLVRSDAWIAATYRNVSAPAAFLSAGAEQEAECGGGSRPAVRRPVMITISS